ncbi:hypothetical protein BDF21DRAFT_394112 [Thamnidium elegans]|nr:hypothetical protein BDF21DRAFT_394112 [Thamnidium elegans]
MRHYGYGLKLTVCLTCGIICAQKMGKCVDYTKGVWCGQDRLRRDKRHWFLKLAFPPTTTKVWHLHSNNKMRIFFKDENVQKIPSIYILTSSKLAEYNVILKSAGLDNKGDNLLR